MREYILIGIKNHPAVTSEYVKFLATHSGYGDIAKMKDTMQELKMDIKRNGDIAKAAQAVVDKSNRLPRK